MKLLKAASLALLGMVIVFLGYLGCFILGQFLAYIIWLALQHTMIALLVFAVGIYICMVWAFYKDMDNK